MSRVLSVSVRALGFSSSRNHLESGIRGCQLIPPPALPATQNDPLSIWFNVSVSRLHNQPRLRGYLTIESS